jgi:predicted nucleic acid-binding protein
MLPDTDVMIDILRGHPPAIARLNGLASSPIGLPGLVAMELIQGCRNLVEQQRLERQLRRFIHYWPAPIDCRRAYQDFVDYRLSRGVGLLDTLIGQTAVGLGETLATFNTKHYAVITGLLTIQPY